MIFQDCKCPYCKHIGSWPVIMHIPKLDLYWFEIPKNGSFAIKQLCWPRPGKVQEKERYQDKEIFAIYREPIERFLSTFKHYFTEKGARYNTVGTLLKLEEYPNPQDRLDWLIDNLDKLGTPQEVHHFYPQVHFINRDIKNIRVIGMQDISNIFKVLKTHNTDFDGKLTLRKDQEDYLKLIYKEDYEWSKTF